MIIILKEQLEELMAELEEDEKEALIGQFEIEDIEA